MTVTFASPTLARTFSGAAGIVVVLGVAEIATDKSLSTEEVTAEMANQYVVPFVRPVMVLVALIIPDIFVPAFIVAELGLLVEL